MAVQVRRPRRRPARRPRRRSARSTAAGWAAAAAGAARAAVRASVINRFIVILHVGQVWGADRAGGDRHPPLSAASTSLDFANSFRFFANVGSMQFTQRQRPFQWTWRPFARGDRGRPAARLRRPVRLLSGLPDRDPLRLLAGADRGRRMVAAAADAVLPCTASRRGDPDRSRRLGLRRADDLRRGVDHLARPAGPLLHAPATARLLFWRRRGRPTAGRLRVTTARAHGRRRRRARSAPTRPAPGGREASPPPFRPPCSAGCRRGSAATSSPSKPKTIIFACMRPGGAP